MLRHFLPILLLSIAILAPTALPAVELPGSSVQRPLTERETFERGQTAYEEGQIDEALQQLRGFIIRYPHSSLAPRANLTLTRIFYQRNQFADARLYLERVVDAQQTPEGVLLQSALEIEDGNALGGVDRLQQLAAGDLLPADQALRAKALSRGLAALDRPLEALVILHQELLAVPVAAHDLNQSLQEQAHALLAELDDGALNEVAFMFAGTAIGQDGRLQQAQRLVSRGDEQAALPLVQRLVTEKVPFVYRRDAVLLLDQLTGQPWLQRAVGVMLPLSGRYAAFGELVRKGMDLALELQENSAVRFIYVDVSGREDAAQAVDRLANEERVLALAGPITGNSAMQAALQAQRQQVPLISLAQREGVPEVGSYIFRDSLTSRLQARVLARYAVLEMGYSSFGVLRPQNRQGEELARFFAEEVLALGGLVTAEEVYPAGATDFRRQVRLLMGVDPDASDDPPELTEDERLADLFVPEFPTVDFDALFIPDYADMVGMIAPQIPFYGMEKVPLLGINGWNSPDLIRNAGRYVEGAVFVDGFFRYSSYPFVEDFVRLYFERYAEEPSILEAQGFDVAGMLLSILDRPGVNTREDVRLALSLLRNYPGVTGATSFDYLGEAEKLLFLLQIRNGNIVQIN
jgi:ABC-type branched-subunit amino acid transport system substrate-binding protein